MNLNRRIFFSLSSYSSLKMIFDIFVCVMESSHIFRKSFLLMCNQLHKCSPNTIASFKVYPNRRWALNWNLYVEMEWERESEKGEYNAQYAYNGTPYHSQCIKCYLSPLLWYSSSLASFFGWHSFVMYFGRWRTQRLGMSLLAHTHTKCIEWTTGKTIIITITNNWWTVSHSSLFCPSFHLSALFLLCYTFAGYLTIFAYFIK